MRCPVASWFRKQLYRGSAAWLNGFVLSSVAWFKPCACIMSVMDFLVGHGCCFAGDRFSVILDFLKNAEVECSADFTGLCCIRLIDGADSLMKSEAEALQRVVDLVSRKGYRSRSVIDSGQSQLVERAVSAEPENKLRRIETHLRDSKEFGFGSCKQGS